MKKYILLLCLLCFNLFGQSIPYYPETPYTFNCLDDLNYNEKYHRLQYPVLDSQMRYKPTRYIEGCKVTVDDEKFDTLKRLLNPLDFEYTKIETARDESDEDKIYSFLYTQISGHGSQIKPERQGFKNGITLKQFTFYIAENIDGYRFLIAIPINIKIKAFKTYKDVQILFLGTIYDDKRYHGNSVKLISPFDTYTVEDYPTPFYVIDYVVLYDKRYCKYEIY